MSSISREVEVPAELAGAPASSSRWPFKTLNPAELRGTSRLSRIGELEEAPQNAVTLWILSGKDCDKHKRWAPLGLPVVFCRSSSWLECHYLSKAQHREVMPRVLRRW